MQTFFAREIRETLSIATEYRELPQQAAALLDKQSPSNLPLMGAIPFDDTATVQLFVPDRLHRAGPLAKVDPAATFANFNKKNYTLQAIPEPAIYMQGVDRALERIDRAQLLKIVLSRSLELSFSTPTDPIELLANLARANRHGYNYLINLSPKNKKNSHWLVGASPELLVRRRGMQVETNPLAGSAPLSGHALTDRTRAVALMNSDKDRREHALVVEAIADTLSPLCRELDVPAAPSILETDTMMHLSTRIQGTLRDRETCALSLSLALHPTPAVCGTPRQSAYAAIHDIEPFARRYFAGMVGWVDRRGDGEWAVTIRCGEARGRRLRLYAGAGVVAGSTAETELAETSAKFRTMLKAIGVEHIEEQQRTPFC